MAKVAVVYWSGTGNTQKMAEALVEGAQGAGADVELFEVDSFTVDQIDSYDGLALGCPSMGAEELEEGSYEPFFADAVASGKLSGKPVVLFGSWGWGAGAGRRGRAGQQGSRSRARQRALRHYCVLR